MPSEIRTDEHVGEWQVSISADSLEELFAEAARLVARECGRAQGGYSTEEFISLSARDTATLLVDWINELIGLSEIRGTAYDDVRVEQVRETGNLAFVDAVLRGRAVETWRSPLKAATYHGLILTAEPGCVRATVLIDV